MIAKSKTMSARRDIETHTGTSPVAVATVHTPLEPVSESLWRQWGSAWDRFWFEPAEPTTLGLIRIFTGCIVFYSFLVWSLELMTFFGDNGVLPPEYRELLFGNFAWSHFDIFRSPTAMWISHGLGLLIVALFTLGLWTRATAVLSALLVISYANRATGALFGLDQILAFLCLYLAVGNSGGAFSLDRWWKNRIDRKGLPSTRSDGQTNPPKGQGRGVPGRVADVPTNIAIRLIQLHLCLVYLFAGLGKLQGDTWWNGQAIWYTVASYEYQTLDMTWMADWMWLVSLITLATVVWEVSYPALVWLKLTRPFVLAFAVVTHLGIGFAMGMMTFGLVMLVANLAFVEPTTIRKFLGWLSPPKNVVID